MLCKMIIVFFKKGTDNEHTAVCDGKSIKMFSDMIRKCLCDEDFVSGMMFKRLFYTFHFLFLWGCLGFFRLSLGPRFYGHILLFVMFVDCALELGVISTEDIGRLASGEIQRDTDEEFSIKTTLEMINLLTNMYSIRKDATESALKYLFTNVMNDNDLETPSMLKRKFTFESVNNESDEGGPKCKQIELTIINRRALKLIMLLRLKQQ